MRQAARRYIITQARRPSARVRVMDEGLMPPRPSDLTRNQRIILDGLRQSGRPLTAYQLLDLLRAEGIAAPPTVYRALDRLTALGHVHRIESLNAYMACHDHGHGGDAAFVICRACGSVEEIEAAAVYVDLRAQALRSGFRVDEARIELSGCCQACCAPPSPSSQQDTPP